MLTPNRGPQQSPVTRVTTDEDGRFKLNALAAGSYTIIPHIPALVVAAETSYAQPGKSVTLGDGEDVEDLMELAIQRANSSIHQMAVEHPRFSMMAYEANGE